MRHTPEITPSKSSLVDAIKNNNLNKFTLPKKDIEKLEKLKKHKEEQEKKITAHTRRSIKKVNAIFSNDNLIPHSKDDGKTNEVKSKIGLSNGDIINITHTMYTQNPKKILMKGNDYFYTQDPEKVPPKRIDSLTITYSKKLTKITKGKRKIESYIGGGVQLLGKLGGENIQNWWHKISHTANYTVEAPYEKYSFSPVALGEIKTSYLLTPNLFITGSLSAKLSAITQEIDTNIGVKTKLPKGLNLYAKIGRRYFNSNNPVIKYGENKGAYGEAGFSIPISSKIKVQAGARIYQKKNDAGNRGEGYIGVNINF